MKKMYGFLVFFIVSFVFILASFGADITLSWGPSEGATGYIIWYGNETKPENAVSPVDWEFPYRKVVTTGMETTLLGVPAGTWYFAATAYNTSGQSPYSNVVSTVVDGFVVPIDNPHQVINVPMAPGGTIQINITTGQ